MRTIQYPITSFLRWSHRLACVVLVLLSGLRSVGQCPTTISTFPYTESFETGPVWQSGGANSDWAWGAPAHPTINSAADGTQAWCVGGLTGSFYANGQQSWLETPCFDLGSLAFPWISFSIFWETEPDYDGAGFQYSLNEGVTWVNLGAPGADNCDRVNWFNSPNITALNLAAPRRGWSGTSTTGGCSSGQGSGGWVRASHCLAALPTDSPIKFRFIFGAGTICNTFDGFAIDDIYIGEAPEETISFDYDCDGQGIQVSGLTSCSDDILWNFGDPASGAENTSTIDAPDHAYSEPGTYTLSLTVNYGCRPDLTVETQVVILGVEVETTDPGCSSPGGTATAVVSGGAGGYQYLWSPGAFTTASVSGLEPGDYSVQVNAAGACAASGTFTIGAGSPSLDLSGTAVAVSCNGLEDGEVSVVVEGGTPGYQYLWSPIGGNDASATDLPAGNYTVDVTDADGCQGSLDLEVLEPTAVVVAVTSPVSSCGDASLDLEAVPSGGTPGYTLTWVPDGPNVMPTASSIYTVSAMDVNGCTSALEEIAVVVSSVAQPSFTWDIDQGCAPLCVTFDGPADAGIERSWSFGDGTVAGDEPAPAHCFTEAGTYDITLVVTDDAGCSASATVPEAISVAPVPVAAFSFAPTVVTIDAPTFQFVDRSANAAFWSWQFGDPAQSTSFAPDPTFTYPFVGCYTVQLDVTGEEGCSASAQAEVCVEDDFLLHAPNSFTPNDDGINDGFSVVTTVRDPAFYELTIWDRWGSAIITKNSPFEAWDGAGVQDGVYIWQVRVSDANGQLQRRKGSVTLLR